MNRALIIGLVILFALPAAVMADRRNYVWTYQYVTIPEGQTELEFYQTTKLKKNNAPDEWEYRIEVETGLTERWDFSVYQIFSQTDDSAKALHWSAVQLRTRYRLGEVGQYLMDPLLYLEYRRMLDASARNKIEGKLILAKTNGQLNVSINPVFEYFWGGDNPTKNEIGLDAGLSWEFSPRFVAGLESTTRYETEEGESETGSYLGPTFSVASGHWWYTAGVAFGLNDDSDDARVRFIMGVGL